MKLGKYKGLTAQMQDAVVTEEDIEKVLREEQEDNLCIQDIEGRPAEVGDLVEIEYTAETDGKILADEKDSQVTLVLGSGTLGEDFEKEIIGHQFEDKFDITVGFPEEYADERLSGKKIIFHVTLKRVQKILLQPLDDDFAKDFSTYETIDEWKAFIRNSLLEERKESAEQEYKMALLDQVVETSVIPLDEEIIDEIAEEFMDAFADSLEEEGMDLASYCEKKGIDEGDIYNEKYLEAETQFKRQSVLHAIAAKEKIKVTDREFNNLIAEFAEEDSCTVKEFMDYLGEEELESIRDEFWMTKALDLVVALAK